MEEERLIAYLREKLDAESWERMAVLVEMIEYGWGAVKFTFKKGQIVGYRLEKTG